MFADGAAVLLPEKSCVFEGPRRGVLPTRELPAPSPRRLGLLRWREEALARTAQRPSAYQPPVSHSAVVLHAAPWWGARADVARRHRDRPVGVDEGEQCCGS